MGDTVDFVALMGPVARYLLGEPNQALSSAKELRFGTHGSISVDLIKGTWFDHEAGVGGGLLDLIRREKGFHGAVSCMEWLDHEGYTNGAATPPPRTNGSGAPHPQPQPQPKSAKSRREAEYYDYLDEAGHLLYQVVRYEPKDFRQRRPDGNGGWIWDINGVRRIPYRLAELTEALAHEHTVFIVEGEKDVNTLLANGVPATCNAMGAGSWVDGLNGFFAGADVVIIPDNDPQTRNGKGELLYHQDGRPRRPGQDHAHSVARALSEDNARRVRLLDLGKVWTQCPDKGDISDWFEAGFKTDDLWPIVEQLPDWTPDQAKEITPLQTIDVSEWEGREPPERDWIVKNRIINCNVAMLAGDGAAGKTTVALQLCVCVASGMPDWLHGLIDRPGPVLFFSAEEDKDEVWRRLKDIVTHYGLSFAELKGRLHVICLPDDENTYLAVPNKARDELVVTSIYERLRLTIERIKPVLAVLESSADLFGGDEINKVQSRRFIAFLRKLARANNCAILLISHPSQSGMQSGSGTSGNTAWNNSVRSRMYFRAAKKKDDDDEENDVRELEFMKNNYGPKDEPVKVVWSNGVYVPLSMFKDTLKEEHRKQEAERAFMSCLRQQQTLNLGEVSHLSKSKSRYAPKIFTGMKPQSQGFNERTLAEAMMRLIEAKKIVVRTGGSKTRPWEYLALPKEKDEGESP